MLSFSLKPRNIVQVICEPRYKLNLFCVETGERTVSLVWQKATSVYDMWDLSLLFGCLKEYLKGGKEGIYSWAWHRFADHAYWCPVRKGSILKTQFLVPSRRYRGGFSLAKRAKPQLCLKRLPYLFRASVSKKKKGVSESVLHTYRIYNLPLQTRKKVILVSSIFSLVSMSLKKG